MKTLRSLTALFTLGALATAAAGCSVASDDEAEASEGEMKSTTQIPQNITYELCKGEPQPELRRSRDGSKVEERPDTLTCVAGGSLGNVVSLAELTSERGAWILVRRSEPNETGTIMVRVNGQKLKMYAGQRVAKMKLATEHGLTPSGNDLTSPAQLVIERGFTTKPDSYEYKSSDRTYFAVTPDDQRVRPLEICFLPPSADGSCPELGVAGGGGGGAAQFWLRVAVREDLEIKEIEETGAIGRPREVLYDNPFTPSDVLGYTRRSRDNVVTSQWLHIVPAEWGAGLNLRVHYWHDDGDTNSSPSIWMSLAGGGGG